MPGAYGFEILGAAGAAAYLPQALSHWPTLEIERVIGAATIRKTRIGSDHAEVVLVAGDQLTMQRQPLRATFTTARPISDEALIHPYLAPAAAIGGYWVGREGFHAGAFALDGGVWAIIGEKGAGKSSLLAGLARRGHGVFADDALILESDVVFPGPRSLDLRQEPARELNAGASIGLVGDRERWRLRLEDVPSTSHLRGWVFLSWGESLQLEPVSGGGRLQRLLRHRMIKGLPPPEPSLMLELASRPAFQLTRPRRWAQLDTVVSRLVETLSAS